MNHYSRDGSIRGKRLPVALSEGYFLPFERSLAESVTLLRDLAKNIRFNTDAESRLSTDPSDSSVVCSTNNADVVQSASPQTWGDILDKNSIVKLCRLLTLDTAALLNDFEEALAGDINAAIEHVQRLSAETAQLIEVVHEISSQQQTNCLADQMIRMSSHADNPELSNRPDYLIAELRGDVESLVATLESAREQAALHIESSLSSGQVEPSIGLLFVFQRLLREVEEYGNKFTARHTSFYYKKMLGGQLRAAEGDRTFVCFTPSPDIHEQTVPAGTVLEAGPNKEGLPVRYHTDTELTVNSSRVSSLCTLHLERDQLVLPESDLGFVTRLFSQNLSLEKNTTHRVSALPAFGAFTSIDDAVVNSQGELGFAFSSSALITRRSIRKLHINIELDTEFESNAGVASALLQLHQTRKLQDDDTLEERSLLTQRVIKRFLLSEMSPGDVPTAKEIKSEVSRRSRVEDPLTRIIWKSTGDVSKTFRDLLLEMVLQTDTELGFKTRLGRFLSHYLLGRSGWLTADISDTILAHGCRLIAGWEMSCKTEDTQAANGRVFENQVLSLLRNVAKGNDDENQFTLHFYHLFRELFTISVTSDDGWYDIRSWTVTPVRRESGVEWQLSLELGSNDPEISAFNKEIHHGDFEEVAPVCKLVLNRSSNFYSYSVLAGWLLKRVKLKLNTHGVTDMVAHAPAGPVDTTQHFPFLGVAPEVGSYLVLGVQEAAIKKVSRVEFEVTWFGLPDFADGFETYFKAYPEPVSNEQFEVRLEYLTHGQWKPVAGRSSQALFGSAGSLSEKVTFTFTVDPNEAADRRYDSDFEFTPESQNGFFRLVLTGPEQAFGAQAFSQTFSNVSMENVKRRFRKPLALPAEPYVPVCEKIVANYEATDMLDLANSANAPAGDLMRFYHVHPFGTLHMPCEQSYLKRTLLPEYSYDGNLMIGISVTRPVKNIDLYIYLDEKRSVLEDNRIDKINWYYLTVNGWRRLPTENLLQDSTFSLNRSGIVSLIMPEDITDQSSLMLQGQFWIRVSASKRLSHYGKIRMISTQATTVKRQSESSIDKSAEARWVLNNDIPGILGVTPFGVHYGQRAAEQEQDFNIRMAERLRHKNRALLPWDYERLVLQHFPDVFKCKCLRQVGHGGESLAPGVVNLIAVPKDPEHGHVGQREFPRLSAVRLNEIKNMLERLAPGSVEVAVHNPLVERLQVRLSVVFHEKTRRGVLKDQLNEDISKFLWPWLPFGYSASFNWSIRLNDIRNYINDLAYVDFVTDFSLLKLSERHDEAFSLSDSVNESTPEVKASFPGSIAAPMRNHFIQLIDNKSFIEATAAGVDELRLSSTFVVGDGSKANA